MLGEQYADLSYVIDHHMEDDRVVTDFEGYVATIDRRITSVGLKPRLRKFIVRKTFEELKIAVLKDMKRYAR